MMLRATVLERGRIERDPQLNGVVGGSPARRRLPATVYDRLFRIEGGREDRGERPIFNWGRDRATIGPWVGVLQVPGLQLEILPKVDDRELTDETTDDGAAVGRVRDNLVEMLALGGLRSARSRGMALMGRRRGSLHDQLVARFLDRVLEEFVRGADREYATAEENLATVRGRLDLPRHLRLNAATRHRFYCRFDALDCSTPIGATLRAACDALAVRTLPATVQQALVRVQQLLADVTPEPALLAREVVFTRQNERFADVYEFAQMILDGEAPDLAAGKHPTYSLLFDMDKVFEAYIAAFIDRYVVPRFGGSLRSDAQSRRHRMPLYHRRQVEHPTPVLHLAPDLHFSLHEPGSLPRTLVADTKWKRLDPTKGSRPERGDLFQLYAYLHRYECASALLLYPHVDGVAESDFAAAGAPGAMIRVLSVRLLRLSENLASAAGRAALADRLEGLLREGFGPANRPHLAPGTIPSSDQPSVPS
jgi:5-methylcytosine-specific restriction enzyme subunit McrC